MSGYSKSYIQNIEHAGLKEYIIFNRVTEESAKTSIAQERVTLPGFKLVAYCGQQFQPR